MSNTTRSIFVSNALPYANGPLHLGHMVGFIQADIWVRYQKLRGHNVTFVGGDDQHGTPIMLSAQQQGLSPQQLTDSIEANHIKSLEGFNIDMDNFTGTHREENHALCNEIYQRLQQQGHIEVKVIKQAFDEEKGMFLPDRYVKGTCPKCHSADQYGDNCEVCGTTYDTTDLIEPYSVLSGKPPIEKESEHYFFKVSEFTTMLREWKNSGTLQPEIANKLDEWFEAGLIDWDISRDAPYWGFEIPDAPGKFFYVWLDAPIGYMASHKIHCDKVNDSWDSYWQADSEAEVYHFVGKDIARFHALFWPAVLHAAGYRTPTAVFVHGFLTIDSAKMSKSRGTFLLAQTYLRYLNPEYLRYYFATKLNTSVVDMDLNLHDFTARFNTDVVGKMANIASRCARFIHKYFDDTLAAQNATPELYQTLVDSAEKIATRYEKRELSQAMRDIMALADQTNQFIDQNKPWILIKDSTKLDEVHAVCTTGLNAFRVLCIYLKPVLPQLVKQAEDFLNCPPLSWDDLDKPLLNHRVKTFHPLIKRIEQETVNKMIKDNKASLQSELPDSALAHDPIDDEIKFADFAKLDLRIGKIISARQVDGSDKLICMKIDLGGEIRNIFSAISPAYTPQDLAGKLTVVAANLAPRKMRFGLSEGMILTSGSLDTELYVIEPQVGVTPGMRVK